MDLLGGLRKEPYKEAEQEVKEVWEFLLGEIYPKICPAWKRRKVQKTTHMSTVVPISDETYVLCLLQKYWKVWKREVDDKESAPRTNKTGRRRGKTAVTPEYYTNQYKIVRELRSNVDIAEGWDQGYQDALLQKSEEEKAESGREDEDETESEQEDEELEIPMDE